MDLFRSGVVTGVISGMDVDYLVVEQTSSRECFFAGAGGGHCEIKYSADGGSLGAMEGCGKIAYGVGGDAALTICRARQREQGPGTSDSVADFDGISHGVNVWITGAHLVVHADTAALAEFQAGRASEGGFGTYPNGKDDEVSRVATAIRRENDEAIFLLLKPRDGGTKCKVDPMSGELVVYGRDHFRVHRRHYLGEHFHNGDIEIEVAEVFRHFQSDKSSSDDDG